MDIISNIKASLVEHEAYYPNQTVNRIEVGPDIWELLVELMEDVFELGKVSAHPVPIEIQGLPIHRVSTLKGWHFRNTDSKPDQKRFNAELIY